VANLFLACLFSDTGLEYDAPIISRQGEVAGRLRVKLQRLRGQLNLQQLSNQLNVSTNDSLAFSETAAEASDNATVLVRVTVVEASGLPPTLSHLVFCQYTLWGEEVVTTVPPAMATPVRRHQQRGLVAAATSPNETDNHFRCFPVTLPFLLYFIL